MKDLWFYKRKSWYMENKKKYELYKLINRKNIINYIKIPKFNLFWPFTSNVRREMG
jgi:hypothetical protein